MLTLHFVLLLMSFLCFVATAVGVVTFRISLLPLGLAFWVLALLIG